jgi:hypothetical protein
MPLGRMTSGVASVNIEDLKNIQSDLQRTASDLELVSSNLAGHLLYLQHSINTRDAADVVTQINKLQATAEDLRDVAQRIDC